MTPKTVTVKDIIERTREAEAGQEWEHAAKLYEQVIKESPVNEYAYDRLYQMKMNSTVFVAKGV